MERFVQRESSVSGGDTETTMPSCSSVASTAPSASESSSESSSRGSQQQSALPLPLSYKRRKETGKTRKFGDCKRVFHEEWELDYLVTYDSKSDACTCLKCHKTLDTVKKYTLQRHNTKMHPDTIDWSREKRKIFVEQQKSKVKKMQCCLGGICVPSRLPNLASYKLGLTLVQHNKALSFGETVVEWAQSCDPDSKVFKEIPKSRQTLTRRVTELANFIRMENKTGILSSPAWAVQMDESTDKGGDAQLIVYARFIDKQTGTIETKFLTILRILGSPNADNIYGVFNSYIEAEGLPKDKLVSFTSDGASVMRSEKGGVAGHLLRSYNPSMLIQHCIVHRQVLAAKDGLQKLPNSVSKTVDDVMKFFKNSHIRREKLTSIIEMATEEHEYYQLVAYHRVRWLSLNDCVQRFVDLLPEIVRYFEEEAHNMLLRPAERSKMQEFYDELVHPEFQLYLYFLQGRLPTLASINRQLQSHDQDLFTAYQKITCFSRVFLEPILINVENSLGEGNIRTDIDEIDYDIATFNQFKSQCISSGQLSHSRLHVVLQNCFDFTLAIGKSLENRFPEMKFVLKNLSFLNPSNRKHSKCDIEAVVHKFCSEKVEVQTTKLQYSSYRNDDSLDFVFLNCDKHADVFFHQLSQMPEYSQFGLLAQTLLCMSPDTVECERGFSRMNLTKNKFSTRLVQSNLDARLTVSMDKRSLSTFPWSSLDIS